METQNVSYKKPSILACTGGIIAGGIAADIVQTPFVLASKKIFEKMKSMSDLSEDEFKSVLKGTCQSMKKSGLKDKNVKILRATLNNLDKISEAVDQEASKITKFIPLPNKIKTKINNILSFALYYNVRKGDNAFSLSKTNKIIIPEKKLSLSVFHEMGHMANKHFSIIGKILQKSKKLPILALPIALIALFKTKKAPNEKTSGVIDKSTNFIKNNAGKLTLFSFLPMLVEEAMASVKGNKFAKQVLNPALTKKVAKLNKIAYSSYLIFAVSSTLAVFTAVKVKDTIAKPHPIA